jgi:hypothetical protein
VTSGSVHISQDVLISEGCNLQITDDSLEGKMAVDPLKNKRCWIKAQIFAQRDSSGAAGVKV